MFRRALRLGARVSVASCAAVVPATAAACLSDSLTQRIEINHFGSVTARVWFSSCISDRDRRHGSPLVKKLAKTAEFWPRSKFKPSVALKRHQSLNDLDVQDDDVALADASEQVPAKEADPAENAVAVAVN